MMFILILLVFVVGGEIFSCLICEGVDILLLFVWIGVLVGICSLVFIVDDFDVFDFVVLKMMWVYWVFYNILFVIILLVEDVLCKGLFFGICFGNNDWKCIVYGGFCLFVGCYCYYYKFYVLNVELFEFGVFIKVELEWVMCGYVLVEVEFVGIY